MIRLAGKRHLRTRVLHGPAERTVVELWLTEIVGLAINGYPEMRHTSNESATSTLAASASGLTLRTGASRLPAVAAASPAVVPAPATPVMEPAAAAVPAMRPAAAAAVEQAPDDDTPAWLRDYARRQRVARRVRYRAA